MYLFLSQTSCDSDPSSAGSSFCCLVLYFLRQVVPMSQTVCSIEYDLYRASLWRRKWSFYVVVNKVCLLDNLLHNCFLWKFISWFQFFVCVYPDWVWLLNTWKLCGVAVTVGFAFSLHNIWIFEHLKGNCEFHCPSFVRTWFFGDYWSDGSLNSAYLQFSLLLHQTLVHAAPVLVSSQRFHQAAFDSVLNAAAAWYKVTENLMLSSELVWKVCDSCEFSLQIRLRLFPRYFENFSEQACFRSAALSLSYYTC